MKIVLATLSRHIYSGWALYAEGRSIESQISDVILDYSLSHQALTRTAMESLKSIAAVTPEPIDLYIIDERQRGGLSHPSSGELPNINLHQEPPTDTQTRRARAVIEATYRKTVKKPPWDGDPAVPFIIATSAEMHRYHPGESPFVLDAAGIGMVIAGAGEIHTGRNVVKVPRHDNVIAELIAIQYSLQLAMRKLPSFKSAREHAVICTTNQEALDAIAYPWGGSKARRLAAGKVIELLNKLKCGEKMDRYAAIFRCVDDDGNPYQKAAKELAMDVVNEYATVSTNGRRHRSGSHQEERDTAVRDSLIASLNNPTTAPQNVLPESPIPLFHFPDPNRKKGTLL